MKKNQIRKSVAALAMAAQTTSVRSVTSRYIATTVL